MRLTLLTFALLLALTGSVVEGTTSSKHARGVELRAKDGSLTARVFADSENLLLDFPIQLRGYLFGPDSYVYLNRSRKTYTIHSYVNLVANLPSEPSSPSFDSKSAVSDLWAAGFRPTGETDLIAGFNATKFVRVGQARGEVEIWVTEEMTPAKLRAVGREIKDTLPTNYWDNGNRVPTLIQAILVFGLPLRIVDSESESSYAEAVLMEPDAIPHRVFQIPSDYRQSQ